jgi:peptidyl-prolyl cis-trans isomerase B (cyclophilin B)
MDMCIRIKLLPLWLFIGLSLSHQISGQTREKWDSLVEIQTTYGNMLVVLYNETPIHRSNFLRLATSGSYDSTIFHRVIGDFMIQGGDIYSGRGVREPDSLRLPAEIVERFYHRKGELAAARMGDAVNPERKSSGCQFYIVQGKIINETELQINQNELNQTFAELMQQGKIDSLRNALLVLQREKKFDEMNRLILESAPYLEKISGKNLRQEVDPNKLKDYSRMGGVPHLDGKYTVFGRVINGLHVIDKIAAVQTDTSDKPLENIYMTMSLRIMRKKEVSRKYGYQYPENL